jgi:hypothetical protein
MFRNLASGVAAVIAFACLAGPAHAVTIKRLAGFHVSLWVPDRPINGSYWMDGSGGLNSSFRLIDYGSHTQWGHFALANIGQAAPSGIFDKHYILTGSVTTEDKSIITFLNDMTWKCTGICGLYGDFGPPTHSVRKLVNTFSEGRYEVSVTPIPGSLILFLTSLCLTALLSRQMARRGIPSLRQVRGVD